MQLCADLLCPFQEFAILQSLSMVSTESDVVSACMFMI